MRGLQVYLLELSAAILALIASMLKFVEEALAPVALAPVEVAVGVPTVEAGKEMDEVVDAKEL